MPGRVFGRREHRLFSEQGAHAVGAHFGRRMQPAEGAHAGKVRWQDVA
jgi:hypothetical protein